MTKVRRLMEGATFDPAELGMIARIFEEIWGSIASEYDCREIKAARARLASIVFDLGRDRQFGPQEISQVAVRLMRADQIGMRGK